MTLTFDSGYTQVVISSATALDAFIADNNNVLNLEVTKDCGSVLTHTIAFGDVNVGESTYTVTASTLGLGTVFGEGVYRFRLIYQDNPNVINTRFAYINDSVACKLIDWYASQLECLDEKPCDESIQYWAFVFNNLLERFAAGSCSDFTYTNACKLYTKLLAIIDNTETYDDCGCH